MYNEAIRKLSGFQPQEIHGSRGMGQNMSYLNDLWLFGSCLALFGTQKLLKIEKSAVSGVIKFIFEFGTIKNHELGDKGTENSPTKKRPKGPCDVKQDEGPDSLFRQSLVPEERESYGTTMMEENRLAMFSCFV